MTKINSKALWAARLAKTLWAVVVLLEAHPVETLWVEERPEVTQLEAAVLLEATLWAVAHPVETLWVEERLVVHQVKTQWEATLWAVEHPVETQWVKTLWAEWKKAESKRKMTLLTLMI
jgi:ABC-type nitrate/sulfonate/bicarbonate transport system substrate-binding protein